MIPSLPSNLYTALVALGLTALIGLNIYYLEFEKDLQLKAANFQTEREIVEDQWEEIALATDSEGLKEILQMKYQAENRYDDTLEKIMAGETRATVQQAAKDLEDTLDHIFEVGTKIAGHRNPDLSRAKRTLDGKKRKLAVLSRFQQKLDLYRSLSVILSNLLIVFGSLGWYYRVQRPADRLAKIQAEAGEKKVTEETE